MGDGMIDELVEPMEKKPVKARNPVKKGKGEKMYISVDNDVQDVIQYNQDGYRLLFASEKDKFLELPSVVFQELSLENKDSYLVSKEDYLGRNPIDTAIGGFNGWQKDFNVTPGDPSSKLAVIGKKKGWEYRWSRPERIGKRASENWEIDHDPDVRSYDMSQAEREAADRGHGVAKSVGGSRASELILMRRRADLALKDRKRREERLASYTSRKKDDYREQIEKTGAIPVVDGEKK